MGDDAATIQPAGRHDRAVSIVLYPAVAEAASVAGALNRTAALRIALMANSPWSARLPGAGQARRELFWDLAFANRPRRWGILPPSETLADHARRLLATDAFLAYRNGRVLRIEEPVSWVELLRSERPVAAWDVDGARHRLQPPWLLEQAAL